MLVCVECMPVYMYSVYVCMYSVYVCLKVSYVRVVCQPFAIDLFFACLCIMHACVHRMNIPHVHLLDVRPKCRCRCVALRYDMSRLHADLICMYAYMYVCMLCWPYMYAVLQALYVCLICML